ncbi:MAG: hypothetical protein QM692_13445 [Thermomicrobiales bacterium]
MRQLVYALRFEGRAEAVGQVGGALRVIARAPGGRLTTGLGPSGLTAGWAMEPGEVARLESEVTFTGQTSFQEIGVINVGRDHGLRFATVGIGYLAPSRVSGWRQGAVTWRVVEGHGQFTGVGGLISSNILLDEHLGVISQHLGVLLLP